MRNQREAARLEAQRETVPRPVEPIAWVQWLHALKELLQSNDLPGLWEYDPHTRSVFAHWAADLLVWQGSTGLIVSIRAHVFLDLLKPIPEQIPGLIQARKDFLANGRNYKTWTPFNPGAEDFGRPHE